VIHVVLCAAILTAYAAALAARLRGGRRPPPRLYPPSREALAAARARVAREGRQWQ
jgi:hypothetical protein